MTTLIAKPVVDKEFWLLHENDRKIGNILAHEGKFQVKINNEVTEYPSLAQVETAIGIQLTSAPKPIKLNTIHGYHTGSRSFNETWDVKHGLPLFTKKESGQCWHAAGWYLTKRGRDWRVEECPKLIYLQRYPYQGPFLTKREAENGKISV
jgi:hypothetical protein